jgi:anti-sigma factor RsiW
MAAAFGHEGDRLSAFLDDELDDRSALVVARHLQHCDACHDELEQLRATRAALRSLPSVTPSVSWMVETAVLVPTDVRTGRAAVVASTVGAVVVLVLAVGFVLGTEQGTVRPPVDQLVVDHVRSVDGGPVVTPVGLDGPGGQG